MMQSYIFQQLAEKGRADGIDDQVRQKDTRTWFRTAAQQVRSVNTARMMNDEKSSIGKIRNTDIGKMVMFFYDPKTKKDLPYYDTFPLIFPLTFYNDGFLGINLHYLPPVLRAKLMNALYQTINNRKYDDTTKLKISYDILNNAAKYRFFRPCVKRYLWNHVRSQFLVIEPRMWDAALMLPTERFKKDTKQNVWLDSQGML
jgi:hypothetical protein